MTGKLLSAMAAAVLIFASAAALGWDAAGEKRALAAIEDFKRADPGINTFFDQAHGYAVFPEITKGAIGIGGASGDGIVFEGGSSVGSSTMNQVTIGLQLGGQTYSEIIFFKDQAALDNFKRGNFEVAAGASAIAAAKGASKAANYERGVAIFTLAQGGLMFEASIGGQEFTYDTK